ncbi:DUF4227 family protein [Sporolactobacillus sp. Y61]|uniref:DUF4227 family protein n=1 Tax=Sporolactobacillus sp. Y61 TaxID=3160863 RepID=A0AAU8IDP2_9BACL
MRTRLKLIYDASRLFLLFTLLTTVFYFGMSWIDRYQNHLHRYDEPGSGAVDVAAGRAGESVAYLPTFHADDPINRILYFLREGE